MVIAMQEVEDGRGYGGIGGSDQGWSDCPGEQRCRRDVPVVAFVAHLQCLTRQAAKVERPTALERARERRTEHVHEPTQAIKDGRVIGSETQDLPKALVQRRVGPGPRSGILDDDDRHRGADDAGHRADRPVIVAGREHDAARFDERGRLLRRPGPPFEQDRTDDGSLDRAAHALPLDRWAGMEDVPPLEPQCNARWLDVHEHRLSGEEAIDGGGVGRRDPPPDRIVRVVLQPSEEEPHVAIALGRRAPVETGDRRPVGGKRLGEHVEADVHGTHAVREQHRGRALAHS